MIFIPGPSLNLKNTLNSSSAQRERDREIDRVLISRLAWFGAATDRSYHYDDETCDYPCLFVEYTYWAFTTLLGGQTAPIVQGNRCQGTYAIRVQHAPLPFDP